MLRRRIVGLLPVFIVFFWLVMMGLLAQRSPLPGCRPEGAETQRADGFPLVASDRWYGIYLPDDVRVGFVNIAASPAARNDEEGLHLRLSCQMVMMALGTTAEITVLGSGWIAKERGLTEADVRVRSKDTEFRVDARTVGDVLQIRVHTAGETIPFQAPARTITGIWGGQGVAGLDLPDLRTGQETTVEVYDPLSMSPAQARVACVGEETLAVSGKDTPTRVYAVTMNSMTTRAWMAFSEESGRYDDVVQFELPIGLRLKRVSPEEALQSPSPDEKHSLLHIAAIRSTGKTPFRDARRMMIRVRGIESGVQIEEDDTQQAQGGGVYVITRPDAPAAWAERPVHRSDVAEFLEGDALIQTGHPIIQNAADAIVQDEFGLWPSALLIHEWLWANIRKENVVSIPSALEVLETRRGDCNEHTVLFTALARTLGIPTRIVLGLVWSEEYEKFYYHAWPEVYIEAPDGTSRWIWMDPTLGQPVADAARLKLVTGGIRKWFELLPFMGRLEIEVIEIE